MPPKVNRRTAAASAAKAKMSKDAQYVLPAPLSQKGWKMVTDKSGWRSKAMSPGRTLYTPNGDKFKHRASSEAPEVGEVPPWVSPMPKPNRKRRQVDMSPTIESACASSGIGLTDAAQLIAFLDSIRGFKCSKKVRKGSNSYESRCNGHLTLVDAGAALGGEFVARLECSGCGLRVQFGGQTIMLQSTDTELVARDNQVAASIADSFIYAHIICGDGFHGEYKKLLDGLGSEPFSTKAYNLRLDRLHAAATTVLRKQIKWVIEELKKLGVWHEGLAICCDCSWNTPGHNAPHSVTCVRSLHIVGAVLAYCFLSRHNKQNPFLATSVAMESSASHTVLEEVRAAGGGEISVKFTADRDVNVMAAAKLVFDQLLERNCSGHWNKNQFKRHCKDPGALHPGTTKPVICKPVQFIKSIAPKYADIVLVDDSALKSEGLGPSGARRHTNEPEEFIVMKTFAGDSSDNELEVGKGSGMLALQARLTELEAARKDRF